MDPIQLRKQAGELIAQAKGFSAELDSDDCDFTTEQRAKREQKIDELTDKAQELRKQADEAEAGERARAERRQRLDTLVEEVAKPRRQTRPGSAEAAQVEVGEPGWKKDPMRGFASPKEFFGKVAQAATRPSIVNDDHRLKYLAAVGSDEQTGASDPYGGFFVPEGMSPDLLSVGAEANPLMALATRVPMDTPTIKLNAKVDKNHTSSVSGGFTVSRRSETGGFNSSRAQFEQITLTANTLAGFAYASEELLRDSPRSIAAIIAAGFADEFPSQTLLDMLAGSGVGEPEGIRDAACTVVVAKESGQTADTIVGTNLLKMRQRAYNYGRSVWVGNHDTYLQLNDAHTTLTNDDRPLFSHGNGTDVPDTLLGRPIFFSSYAETVGDKGDIYLADMSQYLYGIYQPLETGESVHVRFENHERAFKFTMRDAGAPWWKTALTPKKGANTLSPFVTLAARA